MLVTNAFEEAREVLEQIESYDYQAYFVGGCVRDLLLKREIGDIDIATSAPPTVIQQIFTNVIPVGLQHGTVIVRHRHQSYEVTTFRIDGSYSDHRHPDSVSFIQTIDQDLMRRDFTMNALAMDKQGAIIDVCNGKGDLKDKTIRTVGNGFDRFTEDPLRIMRALRFSSQLGFTISKDTFASIELVKGDIEKIAVERLGNEMEKLFAGDYVRIGLAHFKSTQVFNHLPILMQHPHMMGGLPDRIEPLKSFGAIIALFQYQEPLVSISEWVKQWKCSNKVKYEAQKLTGALQYYKSHGLDHWLVYNLPAASYENFVRLVKILFNDDLFVSALRKMEKSLPIKSKKGLATNGDDVCRLFPDRKSGPWIQAILNALEKEVISGNLTNDKTDQKEWIKWNPTETD